MASDEEWFVQSHVFSRENDPSSVFSEDNGFIQDYLAPSSTTSAREDYDTKPTKNSLEKELDKLASLKKHPPPRAVSVQDF